MITGIPTGSSGYCGAGCTQMLPPISDAPTASNITGSLTSGSVPAWVSDLNPATCTNCSQKYLAIGAAALLLWWLL